MSVVRVIFLFLLPPILWAQIIYWNLVEYGKRSKAASVCIAIIITYILLSVFSGLLGTIRFYQPSLYFCVAYWFVVPCVFLILFAIVRLSRYK